MEKQREAVTRDLAELEAIYAHAPIGLAVFDTDLRFVRVNERLAEINGFSVEEHLGRVAWELVPDLQAAAEPLFRRVLETGQGIYNVELVGETPARPGVKRVWIEHYLPLKSPDGRVLGLNVVVEEVTEQYQARQALQEMNDRLEELVEERTRELRESELFHRLAVEAGRVGTWELNLATRECRFSPLMAELMGFAAERTSVPESVWMGAIAREDRAAVTGAIAAAVERDQPFDLEFRIELPDGTQRWLHSRARVIRSEEGGTPRMRGASTNATQRKQTERHLQQALQEVMQDTSWLAHRVMEKLAQARGEPRTAEALVADLTPREREVLALLAAASSNKAISERLGLAPNTVRNYVASIYAKIGARSRAEAVVWARERGITGQ